MLPLYVSGDKTVSLLQTNWAAQLNPVLASPISTPILLTNVSVVTGIANNINHKLGRKLVGWIPVRIRAQTTLWDTQDVNPSPNLSLYLRTSANTTIDILVF